MKKLKTCRLLALLIPFFFIGCDVFPAQANSTTGVSSLGEFNGAPNIVHYNRSDFNADPQFWAMCEDNEGVMYFGNNDGALVFDGESWQKVILPNGSSVRSLYHASDGNVYAGGFNEFGLIRRNRYGIYEFESLLELINRENQNFESVWNIQEAQDHIVFRSFKMLIAVSNHRATVLPSDQAFTFSTVTNGVFYLVDNGILKTINFDNLQYENLLSKHQLSGEDIVALLEGREKNELLVITKQGSILKLDRDSSALSFMTRVIAPHSNNLITCAHKSREGLYFLGTLSSKILILNSLAEKLEVTEAFQQLQDQTVLNIYETGEGNIWALLNNGLDCIDLASPVTTVFEEASVYDVKIAQNKVYIASNQGVYASEKASESAYFSKLGFSKVQGMEGQAWTLQEFEGNVLVSHDKGVFVISPDGETYSLPHLKGVWKVIPINGKRQLYLACAYDGLYLLEYGSNKRFGLIQKIEGFEESSRDILQSKASNTFWVCHGYKGVYRIRLNDGFTKVAGIEHYKDQNGLPSPYSVNVFEFNGETIFTTNHGIFTFDDSNNQFVPQSQLNGYFGTELNVRKVLEDQGKFWFVHDDEAGYLELSNSPELNKGLFTMLKGEFNRSMECILPIDRSLVLMGTRKGLFAFDLTYGSQKNKSGVVFRSITYSLEQEGYNGEIHNSKDAPLFLPHHVTNLKFNFAVPGFHDKKQVQYAYLLEGSGQPWSAWTEKSSAEFSYLKPGNYMLTVKARSRIGEESAESYYYFNIAPQWYQTPVAIILFALLVLLIVSFLIFAVKRKIKAEKEKARVDEAERTKLLELEIQQMKLEHEKRKIERDKEILEEDVVYKSKELANYTMLLVKKKDLLNELNEEIRQIRDGTSNEKVKSKLRSLQSRIKYNLSDEEHLQVFDSNFERVHQAFFRELKMAYPNFSTKELRLCAFVKMNLTNKEIASILNISVRGVETARYRMRKRLSLDHEVNMVEFLDSLSHSGFDHELEENNLNSHDGIKK
ncbi:triple tyrosine motif-containing protein [Negadavirga shengliensis]|uniref:Triple tyrosine motif-containing protein n=1 Tax=Negadavirga shengliensis TaxID=1389218 RepID=A0ABV9T241_9BACT